MLKVRMLAQSLACCLRDLRPMSVKCSRLCCEKLWECSRDGRYNFPESIAVVKRGYDLLCTFLLEIRKVVAVRKYVEAFRGAWTTGLSVKGIEQTASINMSQSELLQQGLVRL